MVKIWKVGEAGQDMELYKVKENFNNKNKEKLIDKKK